MMHKGTRLALLRQFTVALCLAIMAASSSAESDLRILRLGTGGIGGTYFPIGSILANAVSAARGPAEPGARVARTLVVAQISNGSLSNVRDLGDGLLDAALVQADIAHWAFNGTGIFADDGPFGNLRAVSHLYPESLHLVARRDSGIKTVRDVRGKRISLDEAGSGTLHDALLILGYYGIGLKDIRPVYLKPTFAARAVADGTLDAFFIFAGYPATAVSDLAGSAGARLIPIDGKAVDQVLRAHPYFDRGVIPAEIYGTNVIPGRTYKDNNGDTPTLTVGAQLLVRADLDEELVYSLTRAIWHESTQALLREGHPKGIEIRRADVLKGVSVPLHPGARRYYQETSEPDTGPSQ